MFDVVRLDRLSDLKPLIHLVTCILVYKHDQSHNPNTVGKGAKLTEHSTAQSATAWNDAATSIILQKSGFSDNIDEVVKICAPRKEYNLHEAWKLVLLLSDS